MSLLVILLKTFVVFDGNIYASINMSQHKGIDPIQIKINDGVNAALRSASSE
jgi:hypothetical protein